MGESNRMGDLGGSRHKIGRFLEHSAVPGHPIHVREATVLLTGATGYVGGRLLRALGNRRVRCMARHPDHLASRVPSGVEVVAGDVLAPDSLPAALHGVDTAYYLIHSLGAGTTYREQDVQGARHFGQAARAAGVRRIIYLGGLGDSSAPLSSHLRSRQETGEVLRACGVPVIEFRASIIIGSGSLSFELVRALVERLPVMICPRWVSTPAQPLGIDDLIAYLVAALDLPETGSVVYEIGAEPCSSYGGLMREYARQRGLHRLLISVPLLTPRLSSLWLGLVTPVYARVGRPLVEGLRNPTIVRDDRARRDFSIRPVGVSQAVARALRNEDQEAAETVWTNALSSIGHPRTWGGVRFGSRLVEEHTAITTKTAAEAFVPIRSIGGKQGWYCGDLLWRLRGWLDLLVGGPGLRRGRRNPNTPEVGSHIDFWRVERYVPDRSLRLRAEMKLPGRAWLEFEVEPTPGGSVIRQTAVFDPLGLAGLFYWYALYPLHRVMFKGMLRRIAAAPTTGRTIPAGTSHTQ